MGLLRSTFYDAPSVAVDDAEIVRRMQAICDEFETYGYRRVGAALRQDGLAVNSKKVRRLMREHDLQPRRRRRFVATTHRGALHCGHRKIPHPWVNRRRAAVAPTVSR